MSIDGLRTFSAKYRQHPFLQFSEWNYTKAICYVQGIILDNIFWILYIILSVIKLNNFMPIHRLEVKISCLYPRSQRPTYPVSVSANTCFNIAFRARWQQTQLTGRHG